MLGDPFDTLYREGADSALIMCVSTHPDITGVPHRIKYYDMIFEYMRPCAGVAFWTGSEILDWFHSTPAAQSTSQPTDEDGGARCQCLEGLITSIGPTERSPDGRGPHQSPRI